jgi:hypothetical protein
LDEILLLLPLSSLFLSLLSLDSVLFFLADPRLFLLVVSQSLSFFFSLNPSPLSLRLGLHLLRILGLLLESKTLSFGSFSLYSLSLCLL